MSFECFCEIGYKYLTTLVIEVLPLVYNALESEHAVVQEKALNSVPDLCETIDYAEVQGVIFPRVAVRSPFADSPDLTELHFSLSFRKRKYCQ